MKKNNKIIITIVLVLLIIILPTKMYIYSDNHAPSSSYKVGVHRITKVLFGSYRRSCSAVDCNGTSNLCFIKLTQNEYNNIMKLWNDQKTLSPIIQTLCENNEVFYESYKSSHEDSIEEYNNLDLNSDGKVTSREYGDNMLREAASGK